MASRERAPNGFRGNSAYFGFVLAHAISLELFALLMGALSGQYQPLMFTLVFAPLYGMLLPAALAVVLVNWWFRFSLPAYLATAFLTLAGFNSVFLFFSGEPPYLWPWIVGGGIWCVVVPMLIAALIWHLAAPRPKDAPERYIPLRERLRLADEAEKSG